MKYKNELYKKSKELQSVDDFKKIREREAKETIVGEEESPKEKLRAYRKQLENFTKINTSVDELLKKIDEKIDELENSQSTPRKR